MKRRPLSALFAGLVGLAMSGCAPSEAPSTKTPSPAPAPAPVAQELKLENLLTSVLDRVEGTEVIVSRVTIPPNVELPKHWHPGEEFAYVLEGSATLWQEGKPDEVGKKGDVLRVPLRQVHTAKAGEEGATILVFRVHEQGQPERIPVE